MDILNYFQDNKELKVLVIVIALDVIFGILRAIKQHSLNSCIGIDGIIRKFGMMISIIFFYIIDIILEINLLGFIPEDILTLVKIDSIGIGDLFGILFIIFEFMSILKNMSLCELPIPIKIQKWLDKVLKDFTSEIKDDGGNKND